MSLCKKEERSNCVCVCRDWAVGVLMCACEEICGCVCGESGLFGGVLWVYVSVEGEVWNLEGQTGLHGCVHEDKELCMEDVSRSCVWRKCLFQWRKRWIFLGLCMCG